MKNSITKPMQSGSATKPMQHKPATKPTQHKPATKPMQHKPATKPVQHKPVTVVLRADSKANNAASPRLNQVTSSTALAAILAVLLLTLPSALHADSQSAFVGVGTTIIHDGQFSWNLPNYIDSIDNIYAKSYARANAGQHSYFLIGRGFKPPYSTMPLDIPHGARIDGFEVTIYRSSTAVNSIKDYSLQITSNTQDLSQYSQPKTNPNFWGTSLQAVTYGSPTDKWGRDWTYSDVDDQRFGVALRVKNFVSDEFALVDAIKVTVYYTLSGPPTTGTPILSPNPIFNEPTILRCDNTTTSSPLGEPVTFTYRWDENGIIRSWNQQSLNHNYPYNYPYSSGRYYRCAVRPHTKYFKGAKAGEEKWSDRVYVMSHPPTVPTPNPPTITPNPTALRTQILTSSTMSSTDPEGHTVMYTYQWFVNGLIRRNVSKIQTSDTFQCSDYAAVKCNRQSRITLSVYAYDYYYSDSASVPTDLSNQVTIVGRPPTAPNKPSIQGTAPYYKTTTFTSSAGAGSTEPDGGDTISYNYTWFVNGAVRQNSSSLNFNCQTDAQCAKGKQITVQTYAYDVDGASPGSPISNSVTVSGSPPIKPATPTLSPSPAYKETKLSSNAITTTEPDNSDVIEIRYAFYKAGVALPIQNSTSKELDCATNAQCTRGSIITVRAYGVDIDGSGPLSDVSNAITISGTGPTQPNQPTIVSFPTGFKRTIFNSSAGAGSIDVDGDPITYRYAWYINGTLLMNNSTHPQLSYSCYLNASCARSGRLSVVVFATTIDWANASSPSASTLINDTPPTTPPNTSIISPTPANKSSTLISSAATGSFDDDGDTITYIYKWWNGTTMLQENSSPTFNCLLFPGCRRGVYMNVSVMASTPLANSAYSSYSIGKFINDTPPNTTAPSLIPANATKKTALINCTNNTTADLDSDPITFFYLWFINGNRSAITTRNITNSSFNYGDSLICQITPFDGTLNGTPKNSSALVIGATPPSTTQPILSPIPAFKNTSAIICTNNTSTNQDGGNLTFFFAWYVNNLSVSRNASNLTNSSFNKGDLVVCQITPTNGVLNGTPVNSTPLVINNSKPVTTRPFLLPTPAYTSTPQVNCTNNTTGDYDNDPIQFFYLWFKNNASTGITDRSITASQYVAGDSLVCQITPFDGTENGTSLNSSSLNITSILPPRTAKPTLSPIPANKTTPAITCKNGTTYSQFGDAVDFDYAWFVNGVKTTVADQSIQNFNYNKNDVVICQITPRVGALYGAANNSSALTIGNSLPSTNTPELYPQPAYFDTTPVTCTDQGNYDPDVPIDSVSISYKWFKNDVAVAGATNNTLMGGYNTGDTLICQTLPFDGTTSGLAKNSTPLVITLYVPPPPPPPPPPSAYAASCTSTFSTSAQSAISFTMLAIAALIAVAYMFGQVTKSVHLEVWAKDELVNLVLSGLFVAGILGFFYFGCLITDSISNDYFGSTPFKVSYAYLDELSENYGVSTVKHLTQQSLDYQLTATAYSYIGFPIVGGWGIAYKANYKALSQQAELMIDMLIPAVVSLKVQKAFLILVEQGAFDILLPLAIILRVFPPTRDLGNFAIALCFGLYVVLPLTFVLYANVFYNNLPTIAQLSLADFAVDQQYWYNAAVLLPQAILLPNISIVIVTTTILALAKAFKVITV